MTGEMELTEGFLKKKAEPSLSRITWKHPLEFLFNILGFSIGIGNVWRFPYLCYKNGGGAFLIPYFIVAIFCGLPLLFMEMALGQFTKCGGVGAWDIVPMMKGIGLAGFVMCLYYLSYIGVIMSWLLFYFAHSFTSGLLPWSTCDNEWNTEFCRQASMTNNTDTETTLNYTSYNATTPTKEFWNNYVLRRTDGIHDLGTFFNWKMICCFVVAWTISFLCVWKGIRTSGKVAYFTVISPYIMMSILLIKGLTLEGAVTGILVYITPQLDKLTDPLVWLDAGGQIFFTFAVGFSSVYGLASYNEFHTNCYRYAYICVIAGCATSIFVGFVIYSYLGHMAFLQGKNVSDVAEGGPGLVFEVFPTAVTLLPLPQVWSVIFFVMLIFFALDSMFGTIEGCVAIVEDIKPQWMIRPGALACRFAVCLFPVLLGIPMLCDGGIYIFELVSMYGNGGIYILIVTLIETISLAWIYGVDRFFDDVKSMIGFYPSVFYKYCYLYVAPATTLAILVAYCTAYSDLKLGDYVYPAWANVVGWILVSPVVLAIPVVAIKTLVEGKGSFLQRWRYATTSRLKQTSVRLSHKSTKADNETQSA